MPFIPLLAGLISLAPVAEVRPAAEAGTVAPAPLAAGGPATEVFCCRFDPSQDRDYDGWPDGWIRGRGPGYPRYVHIRICEDSPPGGGRSLRVDLDGGGALAQSPRIPVHPASAYVLEAALQAAGLQHDQAYVSLTFLNAQRGSLGTFCSEPIRPTGSWRPVRLGPLTPHADAAFVVIGFHVQPPADAEDLRGSVWLGDVRLGRLPRVNLTVVEDAGKPGGRPPLVHSPAASGRLFDRPTDIRVGCRVSGLDARRAEITFCLQDAASRELARQTRMLDLREPGGVSPRVGEPGGVSPRVGEPGGVSPRIAAIGGGYAATASWRPPIPGPGFYRVRATVAQTHAAELTFAVIEPRRAPAGSEFGWSLPPGGCPLPPATLGDLLCQVGVGWVKIPLVPGDGKPAPLEPLVAFGDRLSEGGVRLVGLACPPQSQAAMELFGRDPKTWAAALELVQGRLGPRIAWWQLGDDRDASWSECPDLVARIAKAKAALGRIAPNVSVGIPWDSRHSPQARTRPSLPPPWGFLSLTPGKPLSADELAAQLDAARAAGIARWVPIEPAAEEKRGLPPLLRHPEGTRLRAVPAGSERSLVADGPLLPVEQRATDLVRRMVVAKAHDAEGIFCPDPFNPQRGLVHADGSPGELLLPWRSTALLLGGTKCLGRLGLPNGSTAWLFQRPGEIVAAIWNDQPLGETVYLGEGLREVDVWGVSRPCPPAAAQAAGSPAFRQSVIPVAAMPRFLVDINEAIARWQLDAALAPDRLPSIPAVAHQAVLRLKNSFAQPVAGRVTLAPPDRWQIEPAAVEFQLAAGACQQWPLEIALPVEVTAGRHAVALEFQLRADQPYRFRAWRQIEVGSDDLTVRATSRLNERGELEVEQTLINQGGRPVSFQCTLLAPDRPRQSSQILGLARGSDRQVYHLADGRELLRKTLWLRAEEIDGPRLLNFRFVAGAQTPRSASASSGETEGVARFD
jgi:hypothetical protein